ncbi:MAG: 4-hydroxy-tetrahydrodipicolinate synthase [Planctomycetes bacterium]|nr:4-hydroxy-tetrahydrodipicolinate synthase [Planctomycetota bacterium]
MFEGSYVAIVTPFADGAVDLEKLRELIDFHLQSGTHGIVPVGTTGESPTLSPTERADIIRTVVQHVRGRVPVIAGTGTNDTRASVEHTRMAKELGADGALVVTPYYNKPSQEGLYRHFEAISKTVDLPLCLYNVPGRTAVNLAPETVARLSKLRNVRAIKEASGSLEQITQIRTLCPIKILSGEDALTYAILCLGGSGVISVAANVIPRAIADLCEAVARGDLKLALELHERTYALSKALFLETNPVPVKTALKLMGKLNGELRLPLCEMSEANLEKLQATLARSAQYRVSSRR